MKVETSRAAGSAVLASQPAVSPGWGLQDPLGKLGRHWTAALFGP
jgi:hypothetical protein